MLPYQRRRNKIRVNGWRNRGEDVYENIVAACRRCNKLKGSLSAEEFFAFLHANDLIAFFRKNDPDRYKVPIG